MKAVQKTDAELKGRQSLFEKLALWSGASVVAGLILEAWLAIEFRSTTAPVVHSMGDVASDILVAGGVFFEILFGRWALRQASELQQRAELALAEATERAGTAISRAALAEERAAEANQKSEEEKTDRLKLAMQFGARTLTDEGAAKLRENVKGKISSKLTVVRIADTEASFLGIELTDLFKQAGVEVIDRLLPLPVDGYGYPAGIYAMADPKIPNQRHEMDALVAELADADLGPAFAASGFLYGPDGGARFPADIEFPWLYVGLKWPLRSESSGMAWRFATPPRK